MAADDELALAARLKSLRNAAGMTQQQLAVAAGLRMSLITQMEQGSKTDPRMSTLLALARALRVNVEALLVSGHATAEMSAAKKRKKGGKG